MPAYVIDGVGDVDAADYDEYTLQVPATLEPYDRNLLVRGGAFDALEGVKGATHYGPSLPES